MKILCACEESQVVTKEFRKRGHEAYSCDIEPCSGGHPEWHLQQDVIPLLKNDWDMIIAFPPCTHLSAAGARYWKEKQQDGRQQQGIDFFMKFADCDCEKVAIENPTGIINTTWRKPDQIFHPHHFGDPFQKRTCLWLKGLPILEHTNVIEPLYKWGSNSSRGGLLKDGTRRKANLPAYNSWEPGKTRSKTFPGIARAMAEQWG